MSIDPINNLSDQIMPHAQRLVVALSNLIEKVEQAGGGVKLSLNNLSVKIDEYSKASDRQANKMYWLTWVLAGTGILNVFAILWQTYCN